MHAPLPLTRDIVLIGGGHAHALVLRRWGMTPLPGARLTVINPAPTAPYTGMLPGFVAGHYGRDELEIDLVRLARFAGARIVLGHADALDRGRGEVHVGARRIGYDVASIDIGIHSDMPDLRGFSEHGVAAKPLGRFAARWAAHLDDLRSGRADPEGGLAVLGAGVAGVELAMAMAHAARAAGATGPVHVIDAADALGGIGGRAEALLRRRLDEMDIALREHAAPEAVTADGVRLSGGTLLPAAFVTGAAGARPYAWLSGTGLALHDGYVAVDDKLRSVTDPAIFAAGDCAHLTHAPRPKAGVFAVRQAPVLDANLRAAVGGGLWRSYRPQRSYLKLVSLGDRSALADRGPVQVAGPWLWRLKDRIDRRFMTRLADLPPMPPPARPRTAADGLAEAVGGGQAPCGGCGAKVGADALSAALAALPHARRDDVLRGAGDDAAVLSLGEVRQALTVDQLSPVTLDPWLMARIATQHALGDIWAMGAAPQAALLSLTLPRLAPALEARTLAEIMQAAGEVLTQAGAEIVGGHTATGPELAIGLTLTGIVPRTATTLDRARPGDRLILTRGQGSGTVMAAEMALKARGPWAAAAWAAMAEGQGAAAAALEGAHAVTDVTGFGLAGHLMALLRASGCGAQIDLGAVPLLPGALALAEAGVRSTLHARNMAALPPGTLPDGPRAALLADPQTSGGLLAAVPEAVTAAALERLTAAGYPDSAVVGEIVDGPPRIETVDGPRAA
ncbi:selenide, water dikinase SelD [Rhodobacteraceae bacterium CCMM004]|nr:selenide, water dikinase SelD [Rhodobacteraceae bacterium CCMM004]